MPRGTLASGAPPQVVLPEGKEPERGVVIAPDIMGLRPLFDDLAQRLATEHRWAVAVVEPFPGREDMTVEDRLQAGGGPDDGRQLGDLKDAADHLAGLLPTGGEQRVGVLGFCMGGMYALKAAGTDRFDRAVAFYGMIRLPEGWRGPGHGEPLDAVTAPDAAPVLA